MVLMGYRDSLIGRCSSVQVGRLAFSLYQEGPVDILPAVNNGDSY